LLSLLESCWFDPRKRLERELDDGVVVLVETLQLSLDQRDGLHRQTRDEEEELSGSVVSFPSWLHSPHFRA
jgi:hypothetical protein